MSYCLVRAIADNLQKLEWFFINDLTVGCSSVQVVQGTQSEFIAAVKKCDYILGMASFNQVIFKKLQLPKVVKSKLMRAIPYALEEFLAEDIDNVHFVLFESDQKKSNDNNRTVAYIKKEQVAHWHQLFLKVTGIAYLMSPLQLLPWKKNEWTLCVGEKFFWLRSAIDSGICLPREYLAPVLIEYLNAQEQEQLIHLIPIGVNHLTDIIGLLKKNRCRLNLQSKVNNIQEIFDLTTVNFRSVNLLQGDFSLLVEKKQTKKVWGYTAMIAGVAVLAAMCLKLFLFHELQHQQTYIQSKTLKLYQEIEPSSGSLDLSQQKILNQLEKNKIEQPEQFLVLLGVLNGVFNQFNDFRINSIIYKEDELKVEANIAVLSNYMHLQQALKKAGANIKRVSAKTDNEQAQVVFLMSLED